MRDFNDLTHDEVLDLWQRLVQTATDFAAEKDLAGLSLCNVNVYDALERVVWDEWKKAMRSKTD